jgi:selenocysteine-specific translation elongation factor
MTKVDKLTARQRAGQVTALAVRCGVEEDQMIPCSATTGEGRDDLAASMAALLAASPSDD